MGSGLTAQLAFAALAIGIVSVLVLARFLPLWIAALVAAAKVSAGLLYFGWLFDGRWVLLDDISYWEYGRELLNMGYDPVSVLVNPGGLTTLFILSGGFHILYPWWNLLAQFLLGPLYYAPVFLNIGLTCVAGVFLYRIARMDGFSVRYSQGLLVFFLLHWDVLVWSSIANLKDVLVMTLVLAACYYFLRVAEPGISMPRRIAAVAGLAIPLLLLPWIRFYVPVLLMGAGACWILVKRPGWGKYGLLVVAMGAMVLVLPSYIPYQYLALNPAATVYGTLRFALTPQPWSIDASYSFLQIPSMLHWLFFIPALGGGAFLWKRAPGASLLLVVLATLTVFYGMVPILQEPRHRLQIAFVWVWMQYHVIVSLVRYAVNHRTAYAPMPTPVPAAPARGRAA